MARRLNFKISVFPYPQWLKQLTKVQLWHPKSPSISISHSWTNWCLQIDAFCVVSSREQKIKNHTVVFLFKYFVILIKRVQFAILQQQQGISLFSYAYRLFCYFCNYCSYTKHSTRRSAQFVFLSRHGHVARRWGSSERVVRWEFLDWESALIESSRHI